MPFQRHTLAKQLSDEGNETKGSSTFWRGLIEDFCGNSFSPPTFLVLLQNMCSVSQWPNDTCDLKQDLNAIFLLGKLPNQCDWQQNSHDSLKNTLFPNREIL